MNKIRIGHWMLLLMALWLTACGGKSEEEETGLTADDCFLDVYVYAPNRPILTRADVGDIRHNSPDESTVHRLQLWVFKHGDASLVGYLDTIPSFLNETTGQEKYQIKVDKSFADRPENVDVYVVANVETCNLTFTKTTTRHELDEAVIGSDYFGTTTLVSAVPDGNPAEEGKGLPMSAILTNQPIQGQFPTLRIGTEEEMATLRLTRAVSRLRFVICRIKEEDTTKKTLVSIDGIKLNGSMIPKESYLMPGTYDYTTKGYDNHEIVYVSSSNDLPKESIPEAEDPLKYAFESQSAQDYENMINTAVTNGNLKQFGLTYLRESDLQLTGTINYTIAEKDNDNHITEKQEAPVTFSMTASGDFLRNHSWIVYIYFMDTKIHILTVTDIGIQSWTDGGSNDHSVYNW